MLVLARVDALGGVRQDDERFECIAEIAINSNHTITLQMIGKAEGFGLI